MPPEQQQPGQGLDPSKLGERLAQRELEAMQGPVKAPEVNPDSARLAEYSQKKAAIEAEVEKKKAELLTPAVESKTAKSNTSNTPPELQHLVGRNINEVTAAPEPPKSSGPIDKIKDFFSKISAGFAAFFKKFTDKIGEFTTKIKEKFTGKKNSPQPVNSTNASIDLPVGPDDTAGLKGDALLKNPNFRARSEQIAAKIGVGVENLYEIFKIESGLDPQIVNKTSGATGLIQWMPKTAPAFGTTTQELGRMTGLQQLDYVEKFFKPYFGKLKNFSDIYRAVFFPAAIGKGPDYVFGAPNMDFARKVAQQNPVFARYSNRPDGLIDNAGFEKYCSTRKLTPPASINS